MWAYFIKAEAAQEPLRESMCVIEHVCVALTPEGIVRIHQQEVEETPLAPLP